jgi:hypothetical protein
MPSRPGQASLAGKLAQQSECVGWLPTNDRYLQDGHHQEQSGSTWLGHVRAP